MSGRIAVCLIFILIVISIGNALDLKKCDRTLVYWYNVYYDPEHQIPIDTLLDGVNQAYIPEPESLKAEKPPDSFFIWTDTLTGDTLKLPLRMIEIEDEQIINMHPDYIGDLPYRRKDSVPLMDVVISCDGDCPDLSSFGLIDSRPGGNRITIVAPLLILPRLDSLSNINYISPNSEKVEFDI